MRCANRIRLLFVGLVLTPLGVAQDSGGDKPSIRKPLGRDVRYYVELSGSRGGAHGNFSLVYNGMHKGAISPISGSILLKAKIDPTRVDIHIDESQSRSGYRLTSNGIEFRFLSYGRSSISLPFDCEDGDVPAVVILNGSSAKLLITRRGLREDSSSKKKPRKEKK